MPHPNLSKMQNKSSFYMTNAKVMAGQQYQTVFLRSQEEENDCRLK
jgi:hypothetical protein